MLNKTELSQIRDKIQSEISDQVINGEQTSSLNDASLAACGQFIKDKERKQKGLYGTASAIRVLSSYNSAEINTAVRRMIKYLENDNDESWDNIIKVSEILFSISRVGVGQANKEALAEKCYGILKNHYLQNKGWSFFTTGDAKVPELLPTIFAIQAISSSGYSNYDNANSYILSEINNRIKYGVSDPSTYAICVMGVHVLSFYFRQTSENQKNLKNIYRLLWKSKFNILDSDIEQNLEFWHNDSNYYVRIPWQLYMCSLSALYSSLDYSSYLVQDRLKSIQNETINNNGFKYPFSGPNVSTRTNAIIFEVINHIESHYRHKLFNHFIEYTGYYLSKIRYFFSSRIVKFLILVLSILISGYILYCFTTSETTNISDIAPELLGSILLWFYAIGKRK